MHEQYKLRSPSWDRQSEAARDFISQLLDRDVASRPTALQALSHPWLQGDEPLKPGQGPETWLMPTLLQRIQVRRSLQGALVGPASMLLRRGGVHAKQGVHVELPAVARGVACGCTSRVGEGDIRVMPGWWWR